MLAAAGLALLAQLGSESSVALVVVASVVLSLGVAPPVTLLTDLIVGCVPPERAGVASGISETGTELGGALGIAVLGSIGVAVYRSELADDASSRGPARGLRGGEGHARRGRRGRRNAPRRARDDAARRRSGGLHPGLQVAALTSAAVALATAALVAVLLRGMGAGSRAEGGRERPRPSPPRRPALRSARKGGSRCCSRTRSALVYGAGGKIGAAVARAFAREGANVFLAGRTLATLEAVAAEISAAGGTAETARGRRTRRAGRRGARKRRGRGRRGASTSPSTRSRWVTFRARRSSRCRSRTTAVRSWSARPPTS